MHWILQKGIKDLNALATVLERFSIPHSEHVVIPVTGEVISPPEIAAGEHAICIGTYSMRHSGTHHGWTPGVFDLQTQSFDVQKRQWGDALLNFDSVVSTFEDATWTDDGPRFIRPCHDSKLFTGAVFEKQAFLAWQKNVCELGFERGTSLKPDTLIQVATPKKIHSEYRCWVVDGEIVTASLYKLGTQVVYENMDGDIGREMRSYASRFVFGKPAMPPYAWEPAQAFCLDVCQMTEGWRVVEINSINSCGFYAADLQKLVMALEDWSLYGRGRLAA